MSDTWTTRDGTNVRIVDMADSHLMNTIRIIERGHARAIGSYLVGPGPRGDMAQDAFDREFDQLDEEGPSGFNEKYDLLVEEAEKRGLDSREKRESRCLALDLAVLQIATGEPQKARP